MAQVRKKHLFSTLSLFVYLTVAGCGGGGDGGAEKVPANPSGTTTISGVAAKGLIAEGVVTATDPTGKIVYASAVTDQQGKYSLQLQNYTGGPVILKVSGGANTTMKNEMTGEFEAYPQGLAMRSGLSGITPGAQASAAVTVLTELELARAEEVARVNNHAAVTSGDLDTGRASMAYWFGFDPVSTSPDKSAGSALDDSQADLYYATLGAIRAAAGDISGVQAQVDELKEYFKDGKLESTEKQKIADIAQAIQADPSAGQQATGTNFSEAMQDTSSTSEEQLPPSSTLSDLAQAKDMFSNLRTTALSIADYKNAGTPGFLDTEGQAVEKVLTTTALPAVNSLADGVGQIYTLIDTMETNGQTSIQGTFLGDPYGYPAGQRQWPVVISKTTTGYGYSINNGAWTGSISEVSGTETYFPAFKLDGFFPGHYEVTSKQGLDKEELHLSVKITSDTQTSTDHYEVNGSAISFNADGSQMAVVNLSKASMDLVSRTVTDSTGMSYVEVTAKPLALGVDVTLAKAYKVAGSITFGDYQTNSTVNHQSWYVPGLGWSLSDSQGTSFTSITFTGTASNLVSGAYLQGVVSLKLMNYADLDFGQPVDTETNFAMIRGEVTGKLQMPDRPLLSLNATWQDKDFNVADITASYAYGEITIAGGGSFYKQLTADTPKDAAGNPLRADLTLTNQVGVQVKINLPRQGDVTGTVSKDGTPLATIGKKANVPTVTYVDGTFTSII